MNPLAEAAAAAQAEADKAWSHPSLAGIPVEYFAKAHGTARLVEDAERSRHARQDQDRATELKARAAAFDEAVEQHAAAEQAEAKRITADRKALETALRKAQEATETADAALARMDAAWVAVDALTAQTAAEWRAAGLTDAYRDGDIVREFETGGGLGRDGLRIGGVAWPRVNASDVLTQRAYGALRAGHGEKAAAYLAHLPGVARLARLGGGLLPDLPAPFVAARPEWLDTLPAVEGAKVVMSDNDRESRERQRAADEQADQFRQTKARQDYARNRAELVAAKGEPYVAALEERLFEDGQPFAAEAAR